MPSQGVIEQTKEPLTVTTLIQHLHRCGVEEGQTILVHLAMSKLGWMVGGAEAVVQALIGALGESGTLMMVTHSSDNTDPSAWENPPVPQSWWQPIRDNMPAYDPRTAQTRGVGRVPELFRSWPGTLRSEHPAFSMAARGPNAQFLVSEHALTEDMGHRSPLGKLYQLDGHVLLLGVTHWNNTSLHYAEYQANYPGKRNEKQGSAMMVNGQRKWATYETLETHTDDFGPMGEAFDQAHQITINKINSAEVRLFRQRLVVDFGIQWLEKNRNLQS
ncbi:MAG: AAC(3) family N-acetyltransferase [Chloroflexota bacterium]